MKKIIIINERWYEDLRLDEKINRILVKNGWVTEEQNGNLVIKKGLIIIELIEDEDL